MQRCLGRCDLARSFLCNVHQSDDRLTARADKIVKIVKLVSTPDFHPCLGGTLQTTALYLEMDPTLCAKVNSTLYTKENSKRCVTVLSDKLRTADAECFKAQSFGYKTEECLRCRSKFSWESFKPLGRNACPCNPRWLLQGRRWRVSVPRFVTEDVSLFVTQSLSHLASLQKALEGECSAIRYRRCQLVS